MPMCSFTFDKNLCEVKEKLQTFSSKSGNFTTPKVVVGREDRDENIYDFRHQKRGLAVIINNAFREPEDERTGYSQDVLTLCPTFTGLGFDVLLCLDFSAKDMAQVFLHAAVCYPHDQADCLACVIMTHGNEVWKFQNGEDAGMERLDCLTGDDGRPLAPRVVIETFTDEKCPSLMNKPRLFFLQTCRGGNDDEGFEMNENAQASEACNPPLFNQMPFMTDFLYPDCLVMYATPPGYCARRSEHGTGCWFVQSLCQVLNSDICSTTSLLTLLTEVQGIVARDYETERFRKKQIPLTEFKLSKDIFFLKK